MTDIVPADRIETIVGARRHPREHIARGVLPEDRLYILHSAECRERYADLRDCLDKRQFAQVLYRSALSLRDQALAEGADDKSGADS